MSELISKLLPCTVTGERKTFVCWAFCNGSGKHLNTLAMRTLQGAAEWHSSVCILRKDSRTQKKVEKRSREASANFFPYFFAFQNQNKHFPLSAKHHKHLIPTSISQPDPLPGTFIPADSSSSDKSHFANTLSTKNDKVVRKNWCSISPVLQCTQFFLHSHLS